MGVIPAAILAATVTSLVVVRRLATHSNARAHGYAMAALIVGIGILAMMLGVALPLWHTAVRREREAELVFRGEQYVQAIRLFQRRYAGTFPPNIDVLVQQRFLRRRYQDPITRGDFQPLYAEMAKVAASVRASGQAPAPSTPTRGGVIGVVSTSTDRSLRMYKGRGHYNEWTFVAVDVTSQAGRIDGRGEQIQAARGRRNAGRLMPPRPPPALVRPWPRR
jgi:type II secretory pathway pseudopilin PulG